jgi:hypothetical protein
MASQSVGDHQDYGRYLIQGMLFASVNESSHRAKLKAKWLVCSGEYPLLFTLGRSSIDSLKSYP